MFCAPLYAHTGQDLSRALVIMVHMKSEFPEPRFELGDSAFIYMEDPAFACYNGKMGCVLDVRWINSKEAGELGVAGWQYQLSIAMPAMLPLEGLDMKLLWCAESMLRDCHEAGKSFDALISEAKATSPFVAGESFASLMQSLLAMQPFPDLETDEKGDTVVPGQCCACGRPARYIMGRHDNYVLSCNRLRPCRGK